MSDVDRFEAAKDDVRARLVEGNHTPGRFWRMGAGMEAAICLACGRSAYVLVSRARRDAGAIITGGEALEGPCPGPPE